MSGTRPLRSSNTHGGLRRSMTSSIPLCRVRAPAMSPYLTISSLRMRHMSSAHGPCQDGKTNAHLQNHLVANGPLEMNVSQSVTLAVSRLGALQQGRHSGVCERNGILVSVKPGGDVGALNVNVRHLTHGLVRTCDVQCHNFHSTVGAPSDSALFVVKDTWAPESLCATLLCVTTAPNNSKLGLASRNPCKIAAGVPQVFGPCQRRSFKTSPHFAAHAGVLV